MNNKRVNNSKTSSKKLNHKKQAKRKTKKLIAKIVCLTLVMLMLIGQIRVAFANPSFIVCIDPGHQAKGDPKTEPSAPGSGARKARVSSGTSGVATKNPEYKVNLEAGLILEEMLKQKGYEVVMTRKTNEVNISNAERAQVANNAKANMTIRLHCDSIDNGGKTGAVILIPAKTSKYTQGIYEASEKYATMLKASLSEAGVKVNGIFERSDMTGFNYSTVPVVILEMGFMSNWNEDKMLGSKEYQTKLMSAVTKSMEQYQKETSKVN